MRKKLYLHIGAAKTATTTIQWYLYQNRAALRRHGILYPDSPCAMDAGESAQHALAWTIHRFKGYEDQSRLRQAVDEIMAQEAPTVIISSEVFEVCTPGQVGELAKYFAHFDVEVILYARNAWGFVTSCYKHNVFYTGAVEDFRTFMLREASRCDFAARSETWGEHFGPRNIHVRLFDKISRHPGVLRDFFGVVAPGHAGLATELPDDLRVNVGIDDASVRAVLLLNRIAQWTGRHAHDSPRVTRWKQRMRRRGRLGRAARVVDNVIPGTYWKLADRRWLTAKAQEWNDRFFPRHAPPEDRQFLEF